MIIDQLVNTLAERLGGKDVDFEQYSRSLSQTRGISILESLTNLICLQLTAQVMTISQINKPKTPNTKRMCEETLPHGRKRLWIPQDTTFQEITIWLARIFRKSQEYRKKKP
jgi:hypothetical protein